MGRGRCRFGKVSLWLTHGPKKTETRICWLQKLMNVFVVKITEQWKLQLIKKLIHVSACLKLQEYFISWWKHHWWGDDKESDHHLISPFINTVEFFIKIMRKKEMIINPRSFDFFSEFSSSSQKGIYREEYRESQYWCGVKRVKFYVMPLMQ